MWWTPDGERILQGAEGRIFRKGLAVIVDIVCHDTEDLWQSDAPSFDNLHLNQKLAVLAEVGSALLQEDRPTPSLVAFREAAVGAVYVAIILMVEMEIGEPGDGQELPTWREMVLEACREREIEELPRADIEDLDEWEFLVGSLADEVLWDEDWKDSDILLDADPGAGLAVKKMLGIDEDYYVAVPPDPTDEEMKGVWATLRELTQDAAGPG